jgi:ankyrin repeat protein
LLFQIFNSNIYLSTNIATLLLKNRVAPNSLNQGGWSPLSIAVLHNQYEAVKFAANWNKRHRSQFDFSQKVGDLNFSLLHLATIKGYTNLIYLLHNFGCSLFDQSNALPTPK